MSLKKVTAEERRKRRVRTQLKKSGYPRLSVHRSSKAMYAQLIDDKEGRTLVSASSLEKGLRGGKREGGKVEVAKEVGVLLGKRALEAGVKQVVFDRGSFLYHGRVKAVAEGARESGLEF